MNMTESPCYLVSCISLAVNAPIQKPDRVYSSSATNLYTPKSDPLPQYLRFGTTGTLQRLHESVSNHLLRE